MVSRVLEMKLRCKFNEAWFGKTECTHMVRKGKMCDEHKKIKCYICGNQAVLRHQRQHPTYISGEGTPVCGKHLVYK